MTADPPPQLAQMGLDAENFKRSGTKSWRGPCPRCGGDRRLLVFTDHPFPKWHVLCDSCGLKAWADQLAPALKVEVTPAQRAEWARKNAAQRELDTRRRRERLAEFTTAELWAELHDRMTAEHRMVWEAWGVPGEWQDYLQIGFVPNKIYNDGDGEQQMSPAYSIPYFHNGWVFRTLQYRLASPADPKDRYRFESGLGTAYYHADPGVPIGERVIICEGAKKAIVANVYGHTGATVLAVPSKSDCGGVAEAVQGCARVYVLLDPDAGHAARKLARAIGPAARVVSLPVKVDDALLLYGATPAHLAEYLKYAV